MVQWEPARQIRFVEWMTFETHPYAMYSVFSRKCHSKHKQWPQLCSGCTVLWHMRKYLARTLVTGEQPSPLKQKTQQAGRWRNRAAVSESCWVLSGLGAHSGLELSLTAVSSHLSCSREQRAQLVSQQHWGTGIRVKLEKAPTDTHNDFPNF